MHKVGGGQRLTDLAPASTHPLKCLLTPIPLTDRRERNTMSTKKKQKPLKRRKPTTPPRFAVEDRVRVKYGVPDPDFPDIPLGGWAGTITEVSHDAKSHLYLIEWNQFTLDHMPPIFRKWCERDGVYQHRCWLGEEDLEPDVGNRVPLEQPTQIVTRPLSTTDQDDRIRVVFGLTSDFPLPDSSYENLHQYHGGNAWIRTTDSCVWSWTS